VGYHEDYNYCHTLRKGSNGIYYSQGLGIISTTDGKEISTWKSQRIQDITSGEHDVKSMRDTIGETKCQSSINRFFTSPSWNLDDVMKRAQEIIFSTLGHDHNLEFLIIDDTFCKKYGAQSEMVCYNHSTILGTVLSHDYVTGLYLCFRHRLEDVPDPLSF
jgi:hypothetical protein